MAVLQIPLDKLTKAVMGNLENFTQCFVEELAIEAIDDAPIHTGRLMKSFNINSGSSPQIIDPHRALNVVHASEALRNETKARMLEFHKTETNISDPLWVSVGAPYGSNVNDDYNFVGYKSDVNSETFWAMVKANGGFEKNSDKNKHQGRGFFDYRGNQIIRARNTAIKRAALLKVEL